MLAADTPLPSGTKPDWFSPIVNSPQDQTTKFINIQRRAFAVPSVALRATVATRLAGEALLFFIGVSLTTPMAHIRIAALKHARAFIAASTHEGGKQLRWDLQLILPGIIVALSDPDPRVRLAAAEAIPPVGGSDPKAVYGYDSVYGSKTGTGILAATDHANLEPQNSFNILIGPTLQISRQLCMPRKTISLRMPLYSRYFSSRRSLHRRATKRPRSTASLYFASSAAMSRRRTTSGSRSRCSRR